MERETIDTDTARARIMVVEDEAIVAMDLEQQLANAGYEVVALLSTGEEAAQRAAELKPDVILMDIRLKGTIDGIEAASRIRRDLDVPVVYLTAHSDEETFRRARITDPMAYVLKPFDRRSLRAAIELGLYRHRTDRKLRQMEVWLTSTLRSIGDALITTDLAGRITYLNDVAAGLTGWSAEEAYGLEFDEIFPLLDAVGRTIESPIKQVLREGIVLGLADGTHLVRRDGVPVPVQDSAAPIRDDAQRVTGAVIVLRDATEDERVRAQLRTAEEQFRHAQKMEVVGRLTGGLAHDFNNLLTVILGHTDLLRYTLPDSPAAQRSLDNIDYAGRRAAELTQQLLAFSRKQVLRLETMNINTALRRTASMLERLIGEDVELVLHLDEQAGTVKLDQGQFEQAILNLATNARDAMPSGGRLIVRTMNVTAAPSLVAEEPLPSGAYVLVEVTDTGVGMDEVTRQRAFDPFFTTKEAGKGTGLGLATVYGAVRQSGGFIHVHSEPGRGTAFRIYLPQVDSAAAANADESAETASPEGTETILIVEDNKALRDLIESALTRARYSTIVCADGTTALDQMRAGTNVDAALLDMVLPRMNGPELAAQVRVLHPHVKVLFMSGYAEETVHTPSSSEMHAHYIQKPFRVHDLCVKLRQLLDAPA